MSTPSRLSLALGSGGPVLPEEGRIAVFAPRAGTDLSALPVARSQVITTFRPDWEHFKAAGFDCATAPEGRYGAAVVFVSRARALCEALLAQAARVTDGPVIVDGAKTDGIEAMLKACRARATTSPPISKAHGKLFWFAADGAHFDDWAPSGARRIEGGFLTRAGVFSADGIDPGSRLLGEALPARLGLRVADLGAGWGYLAAEALAARADIEEMHLIEADMTALDCARANVTDPRARFHWQDARGWRPETPLDTVITNPPFHTGRAPDPALGRAFIAAAANVLGPRGQLFLVANRHLPYEADMARAFAEVSELGGDARFKLLHGRRPMRERGRS